MNEPTDRREAFDTRLRALRPIPPESLRGRCMPASDEGSQTSDERQRDDASWREVLDMQRRRRFGRAAAIGMAAVLVIGLVFWGLPGRATSASAEVLERALEALTTIDRVRAAHVVSTADDGPGTDGTQVVEMWLVAGRGARAEVGSFVEVHDLRAGRRATFDRATGRFEAMAVSDPMQVRVLLERTSADHNVETLRALAARDAGSVTDDIVRRGQDEIRRLTGTDARGRPILVELDPVTGRVRRTEGWTYATETTPAVRVVTVFEYPDPARLDPGLFDTTPPPGATIVATEAEATARLQCMIALRDLATMAIVYANEHGGLPTRVEELAPYAMQPIEDYLWCTGPDGTAVLVESRLETLAGRATNELDSTVVLFSCPFGQQELAAFADGHVEVRDRQ